MNKSTAPMTSFIEITADEQGKLPSVVDVLRPVKITGSPTKPDFEVTSNDLQQYAENFSNGVRKGVPVDIEHGQDPTFGKQAAGWVKRLFVDADDKGAVLRAEIDWNQLGTDLVGDRRFRFISPQFVPKSLGAYEDPEGKGKFFNVLKAVTITNMPLFKGLKPISASEESTSGLTVVMAENTIDAKERVEMKLEDVRKKKPSEISADERAFLLEHKSELSASEIIGFEIEKKVPTAEEIAATEKAKADAAAKAAADLKATEGKTVTVDATEWASLKDKLAGLEVAANEGREARKQLLANEVHDFVQTHVKRGAIKAGEAEATEKMILASEGDSRENMKKLIENLPDRMVQAGESGLKDKPAIDNAADALDAKIKELQATDAGKNLSYADAAKKVISANEDLAGEYKEELARNQGGIR